MPFPSPPAEESRVLDARWLQLQRCASASCPDGSIAPFLSLPEPRRNPLLRADMTTLPLWRWQAVRGSGAKAVQRPLRLSRELLLQLPALGACTHRGRAMHALWCSCSPTACSLALCIEGHSCTRLSCTRRSPTQIGAAVPQHSHELWALVLPFGSH